MKVACNLKNLVFLFISLFLIQVQTSHAACSIVSSNGYTVNIEVEVDSVIVQQSNCNNGWYNFNVRYNYNITFTGSNIPNNLWTLQANLGCDDGTHFMQLPNDGGQGVLTTYTNVTRRDYDCASATPVSLGCTNLQIQISGPGISYQTVSCDVTALPVELTSFEADRVSENQVRLIWETASELNNDYFTVQRSVDAINFEDISYVEGAGTTNEVQRYSEIDDVSSNETVYYRLKQTDFDGTTSYSPVKLVRQYGESNNNVTVYPNPSSDEVIKVDLNKIKSAKVSVTDLSGKILSEQFNQNGVVKLPELPNGVYIVTITNELTGEVKRIKCVRN